MPRKNHKSGYDVTKTLRGGDPHVNRTGTRPLRQAQRPAATRGFSRHSLFAGGGTRPWLPDRLDDSFFPSPLVKHERV